MPAVESIKEQSVTIRFPRKVLTAIKAAAKENGRSQNSEVVYRLAESLGINGKTTTQPPTR